MKQNITIKIAGKEFSLQVESEMEEIIRKAVDRLDKEITSLQYDYHGQDLKDILSVVLLSEEMNLLEIQNKKNIVDNDISSQLEELDKSLGEYLLSR